jgi:hypothetical protein
MHGLERRRRTFQDDAGMDLGGGKATSQYPIRVTIGAREMQTFPRQRPGPFPAGLNIRHTDRK